VRSVFMTIRNVEEEIEWHAFDWATAHDSCRAITGPFARA